ncbi:TPA: hypothetical protein ACNV6G_000036 [Raoultella ornithinolytica]
MANSLLEICNKWQIRRDQLLTQRGGTTAVRITAMIDKYRLDDLRLESGEKGELARWVIQLQTDLDRERRKVGNYPVIPDTWTGNDKANAALMMLDRIETVDPVDDDRIDGIKRIVRELAAAPQEVK